MFINHINTRIFLVFSVFFLTLLKSQSTEELKKFMETYDKIKVDQQANEVVKKGIDSEKSADKGPMKLLITPGDITNYYNEKIISIRDELDELKNMLSLTDTLLPITDFGYNYFNKRDSVFYIDNLNISKDYILDYGDEIIISVWGQVEQYEKKIINRDGSVFVSNVGSLSLGGKTLKEANTYIFNRFSKVYSTLNAKPPLSFIDVSVGQTKKININVSGHIMYPGNYVVNPSVNIINLLIISGGITNTGTLRNIYISRENTLIDSIDLYPAISGLSYVKNFNFLDGDVVLIPPKNHSIALTGSVRIPAYYEISSSDNLNKMISFAGGLTRKSMDEVFIYRKEKDNLILKLNDYKAFNLINGDSLFFPESNYKSKFIYVTVDNGLSVKIPWLNNLSYKDIFNYTNTDVNNIKNIELVRDLGNDKLETYILQNFSTGEFFFLPYDFIFIQQRNRFEKLSTVFVEGLINSPGLYPLIGSSETLNSIISRAGGLKSSTNLTNVTVIRDSMQFGSMDGNIILSPNDTILVKSFNGVVKLEGEIHNPGNIEWIDERLSRDYIKLAGGLTSSADKRHIVYITPFGEAIKIKKNSRIKILPGSSIRVSKKKLNEKSLAQNSFQQFNSIITSLVSLAILARTSQ